MRDAGGLVAEVYSLGGGSWSVVPVTRGALGQIWKLSGGGRSWAVKELLFECDVEQVGREAALRNAAEELGIASPRLLANRDGSYVTRLPSDAGASHVKLYDWIDGTEADPSDPALLDWLGRTTALLHRAGEGTADEELNPWYTRCPEEADWTDLHEKVQRAGLDWAGELGRFIGTSAAELGRWVTSVEPGDVVTSHLDLRPANVLVGREGPVLLDWDNAGPASAEQEFARAVFVWSGGNRGDVDAARRVGLAYRRAGGRAVVSGPASFSMLFATHLNYIRVQAECAIDPTVTAAQRAFASGQVVESLRSVPELAVVSRLVAALDTVG
ncbi:aminoglycoside phosphotransferase family protein [Streptomyces sp. NPDC005648]|uniref:phosphotransferase enzyme family protein n=1 Tax=Streptomyces sp. NPDC005648 TaxID=3157044 RepID=UPI0033ABA794